MAKRNIFSEVRRGPGRPRSLKAKKTRRMVIRLEPALWNALDELAEREMRSLNQIGYLAVRKYLKENAAAAPAA